jgi:hypothetical protein
MIGELQTQFFSAKASDSESSLPILTGRCIPVLLFFGNAGFGEKPEGRESARDGN